MSDVSFFQWETKSFEVLIEGAEAPLQNWKQVIVTLGQNKKAKVNLCTSVDAPNPYLEVIEAEDKLVVHLSQEDTGLFKEGMCTIQVNIYYEDTERDTTFDETISVYGNMYKKRMEGACKI